MVIGMSGSIFRGMPASSNPPVTCLYDCWIIYLQRRHRRSTAGRQTRNACAILTPGKVIAPILLQGME